MTPADRGTGAPDFFCVGVQKAGTSWLDLMLRPHPQVWLPPFKELQYFNELHIKGHRKWTQRHRSERSLQGLRRMLEKPGQSDFARIKLLAHLGLDVSDEWYRDIFRSAPAGRIAGECTPEYSFLPDAGVEHLLALAPAAKIILMLRDPVDRAWSHIRMLMKNRAEASPSPDEFLKWDVLERGHYRRLVTRWRQHLPAERLRVLFYDDIRAAPAQLLEQVCAFLDIRYEASLFPEPAREVHKGIDAPIPPAIRARLVAEYTDDMRFVARQVGAWGQEWVKRYDAAA